MDEGVWSAAHYIYKVLSLCAQLCRSPNQGESWRPERAMHQPGGQSGEGDRLHTIHLPSIRQWFLSISYSPWGHRGKQDGPVLTRLPSSLRDLFLGGWAALYRPLLGWLLVS